MARDNRDIERLLEQVSPPLVVEDVHRDRLREELLKRMYQGRVPSESTTLTAAWRWVMKGYQTGSLVSRLAWACVAVLVLGAAAWGSGQAIQLVRKSFTFSTAPKGPVSPPRQLTLPDGTNLHTSEWSSDTITISSDDPKLTEADAKRRAELVLQAKATGKGTALKRVETEFGTVVHYSTKLPDGTEFKWAGRPEDVMSPAERAERQKQIDQLIASGNSEFIGKLTGSMGETVYNYRIRLPDGTSSTHASNMPVHDPAKLNQHADELRQAQDQGKGSFVKRIEIGSDKVSVYRVPLSDGDVALYFKKEAVTVNGAEK
jgi:hypothetical protein